MRGTIQLRSKLDKNKVGTYRIEISTGKQPDGTYGRIRETFRGTKQQAELRKAELLIKLNKNEYIPDSNMTFGELAERWIENVRVNLAPNTHRFYKDILDPYILPEIKDLPVSKLNSVAIRTLINKMKNRKTKRDTDLSNATIGHIRSTLSACLQYAVDELELLEDNPCASVRIKGSSKMRKIKSTDVYNENQVRAFLEAAKEELYFMYFLIAVSTGMRQNEILALPWDNVDFRKGKIKVEMAIKQNTKDGIIVGDPKTQTGHRSIAIDRALVRELRKHKMKQNEQKLKMGPAYTEQNLVIANELGKVVNSGQLRKVMKRIAEKAKVPYIPPKNLRHTHATLLLYSGVNPKVVQERLGHSDIMITLNVYSAMLPIMQAEAAEKFGELLQ
jgi:integrase